MALQTSTLRPGFLVSLKTSLLGNVSYTSEIVEAEHKDEETGAIIERWDTTRTVADAAEHKAGREARGLASTAIRSICAKSAFGLLCSEDRAEQLEKAIAKAKQIERDFNETAKISRLHVFVLCGRVAPDDVRAVQAINSEIKDLMDAVAAGLKNLDVKVVRESASKMRSVAQMLSADAQARVQIAIDTSREAAKKIVKAAEIGAAEIDLVAIRKVTEMRAAFLDLDEGDGKIAKPKSKAAAVDLIPADKATSKPAKAAKAKAAQLDL